ncbi:MFS transporter [Rhodococcus sp. USK10]|uniref:L-Proline/Glycine betaine transporter ProP n=1 Tax=Rhodococcus wratislaviensis TaxID=44752 RepID=A0A402CM42_RHOWR|nr:MULTISPECIES: MFS transporter [Rhodococcus]QYB07150.1 MFS transporter [Rhodococcus sp. USK10]GCE44613.1 L-Proline/Glycine betaine transporter ProP [Rhodococcus wratislaviensis]
MKEETYPDGGKSSPNRRAFVGAISGNAFEAYDTAIYGFLAVQMGALFFPGSNHTAQTLGSLALFGLTFFVRPLGALIFGPLADRIGRTPVLVLMISLMALATAAVGLLPAYSSIGITATVALVGCRMLQGLAVGGEYGTATSFLTEYSRRGQRGFGTSWYIFSSLSGFLLGSLMVTGLSALLSDDEMMSWGWRIAFLIAAPLGSIAIFIRLRIEESPEFARISAQRETSRAPLRETLSYGKELLLTAGVGTLHSVAFYMAFSYATTYVAVVAGQGHSVSFASTVVACCVGLAVLPFGGKASDKWGRRRILMIGALWCVMAAYPGFLLMSSESAAGAFAGQALLAVGAGIFLSTSVATMAELFPTRVRSTGSSVGYNAAAALFGGTAPFISTFLVSTTGNDHSPALYLCAAAIIALIAVSIIRNDRLHTGAEVTAPTVDADRPTTAAVGRVTPDGESA